MPKTVQKPQKKPNSSSSVSSKKKAQTVIGNAASADFGNANVGKSYRKPLHQNDASSNVIVKAARSLQAWFSQPTADLFYLCIQSLGWLLSSVLALCYPSAVTGLFCLGMTTANMYVAMEVCMKEPSDTPNLDLEVIEEESVPDNASSDDPVDAEDAKLIASAALLAARRCGDPGKVAKAVQEAKAAGLVSFELDLALAEIGERLPVTPADEIKVAKTHTPAASVTLPVPEPAPEPSPTLRKRAPRPQQSATDDQQSPADDDQQSWQTVCHSRAVRQPPAAPATGKSKPMLPKEPEAADVMPKQPVADLERTTAPVVTAIEPQRQAEQHSALLIPALAPISAPPSFATPVSTVAPSCDATPMSAVSCPSEPFGIPVAHSNGMEWYGQPMAANLQPQPEQPAYEYVVLPVGAELPEGAVPVEFIPAQANEYNTMQGDFVDYGYGSPHEWTDAEQHCMDQSASYGMEGYTYQYDQTAPLGFSAAAPQPSCYRTPLSSKTPKFEPAATAAKYKIIDPCTGYEVRAPGERKVLRIVDPATGAEVKPQAR